MSDKPNVNEVSVDHRAETIITQQPGDVDRSAYPGDFVWDALSVEVDRGQSEQRLLCLHFPRVQRYWCSNKGWSNRIQWKKSDTVW